MAAYRRVYYSHHLRLTTKNRDQLRNPTLGNREWATFTFLPTDFGVRYADVANTRIRVLLYAYIYNDAGLYLSNFIRGVVEVLAIEVDDRANA